MSGSSSSHPSKPSPDTYGLGITSNPTSGRSTPTNAFGIANAGPSAINNPRIRPSTTQMQQHMNANAPSQEKLRQQTMQQQQRTQQQTNPNMLNQQQLAIQQHQRMQQIQMQRQQMQQSQVQHQFANQQQAYNQQMNAQAAGNINPIIQYELPGIPMDPTLKGLLSAGEATNPTYFRVSKGMPLPELPPPQGEVDAQEESAEEEEGEAPVEPRWETNTLYVQIKCPLTITGDNNIISLDPAPQIKDIADAVFLSLSKATEGARGIPTADPEGNPRGLRLDVSAPVSVNGKYNIIGIEAVKSWGKAKVDSLATQKQEQKMLSQAHAQGQANTHTWNAQTAQGARGQAQEQGDRQVNAQRGTQPTNGIAQAQARAEATQKQFQGQVAITQGQAATTVPGQPQANAGVQGQAAQTENVDMMSTSASSSKDGTKRALEASTSQNGEVPNKKFKKDM